MVLRETNFVNKYDGKVAEQEMMWKPITIFTGDLRTDLNRTYGRWPIA